MSAKNNFARCSTPFGITEFRGGVTRDSVKELRCAQRLSASQSFAVWNASRSSRVLFVLNAFRHHRVSRVGWGYKTDLDSPCSTPFGITEFRGSSCRKCSARTVRAQRLSASQSFAGRSFGTAAWRVGRAQRLSASQSFAASRAA